MRSDLDEKFMQHALMLADRAEALGEIPVGAVLVGDEGNILGEGWNLSIIENDPTAHAEIVALRNAAQNIQNYRLLNTTLMSPLSLVLCVRARFCIVELNV